MRPRRCTDGVPAWQPSTGHRIKLVLTWHDRLAVVQPRLRRRWRFTAKWFCVSGFASATGVMPCSGSVNTAIADSVIAVPPAAPTPGDSSDGAPTAGISGVPKAASIIAIANGGIVVGHTHP